MIFETNENRKLSLLGNVIFHIFQIMRHLILRYYVLISGCNLTKPTNIFKIFESRWKNIFKFCFCLILFLNTLQTQFTNFLSIQNGQLIFLSALPEICLNIKWLLKQELIDACLDQLILISNQIKTSQITDILWIYFLSFFKFIGFYRSTRFEIISSSAGTIKQTFYLI